MRMWFAQLIRKLAMLPPIQAQCSFCYRSYSVAGPFAEGPNNVLICGQCVADCGELIARESKSLRSSRRPIRA